eukprot:m.206831 g.206831  ORF g.206831 m.206831 type:complete len:78 (+) comp39681_c0_seq10:1011-1244(+)
MDTLWPSDTTILIRVILFAWIAMLNPYLAQEETQKAFLFTTWMDFVEVISSVVLILTELNLHALFALSNFSLFTRYD